ncbi:MAG: hypothetical protein AUJ98_02690 [Bacteroidetes bacterium CG2_30_33_31]|nr:MAG: hypothetical protein AUJ98_02690 [Bacteroidetes bacterium CG2_30_33_31]
MANMVNPKEIKILHLARWYPNKFDPMFGLFVKKHVEATSLYCPNYVIYAHGSFDLKDSLLIDYKSNTNLTEIIVYYKKVKFAIDFIANLINGILYLRAINKGFKRLKCEDKKFNLIHIHILSRLGIFGLYYKLFKKTPYVITEHWSRYLPTTANYNGFFRKIFTKIVVSQASFVSTVTNNLKEEMQNHGLINRNYFVLPNVVSKYFYYNFNDIKNSKKTFIHVSSFEDKSKNISGLIRVINELSKKRSDFVCKLIGEGIDFEYLSNYAQKIIKNQNVIQFIGLLENENLAREYAKADMMIIFSNYENFPVVINESLVAGLPVISTKVGGISEMINSQNGILINAGDEDALIEKLLEFLDDKFCFNKELIKSQYRDKFSEGSIGKLLFNKYNEIIKT